MKFLAVDLVFRLRSDGCFPHYKGSMLRGALGTSLRNAVCMTKKTDCSQCMLGKTCIFTRLFTAPDAQGEGKNAPALPPPYCIEPPLDGQRDYPGGARFSFRLKLFSYAVEYLPYFIHAFSLAGKRGLGKYSDRGQGQCILEDILQNGVSIYDAAQERLHDFSSEDLNLPTFTLSSEPPELLELDFITPLRFKQANHLSADLPFSSFITLCVRRLRSLWALENQPVRLDNFEPLMETASRVAIYENALHWQDWSRYSGRQNTCMQLGGLAGKITYSGELAGFSEFIALARKVHLGKQTSFGLGAFTPTERGTK